MDMLVPVLSFIASLQLITDVNVAGCHIVRLKPSFRMTAYFISEAIFNLFILARLWQIACREFHEVYFLLILLFWGLLSLQARGVAQETVGECSCTLLQIELLSVFEILGKRSSFLEIRICLFYSHFPWEAIPLWVEEHNFSVVKFSGGEFCVAVFLAM